MTRPISILVFRNTLTLLLLVISCMQAGTAYAEAPLVVELKVTPDEVEMKLTVSDVKLKDNPSAFVGMWLEEKKPYFPEEFKFFAAKEVNNGVLFRSVTSNAYCDARISCNPSYWERPGKHRALVTSDKSFLVQEVKLKVITKDDPNAIPNAQVPAAVDRLFEKVFGHKITHKESVYWKNRARTDKRTEAKLEGAMYFQKARGRTMPVTIQKK